MRLSEFGLYRNERKTSEREYKVSGTQSPAFLPRISCLCSGRSDFSTNLPIFYSCRNASMGSIIAARYAG